MSPQDVEARAKKAAEFVKKLKAANLDDKIKKLKTSVEGIKKEAAQKEKEAG